MPVMDRMKDRSAIITGATSGMGRATALLFAREGASIVASGRDEARGQSLVGEILAAGGRAEFVPGDVSLLRRTRDSSRPARARSAASTR